MKLLIRTTILGAIVAVTSGCGIITIDRGTPPLSIATAQKLAENYYNTCNDYMDFGQCANFLPDPPSPLIGLGWVKVVRTPQSQVGLSYDVYKLTAAGAKRCSDANNFGGGVGATSEGDDAKCNWLYAPATVTIKKLMQHDNAASIIGVVTFSPNPAIERYLFSTYSNDLINLKKSQGGKPFDFKLTFGGDSGPTHWRIGDPESESMGGFFIGTIVIGGMIVLGAMGLGNKAKRKRQANPFAGGPSPAIGFSDLQPAMRVANEPSGRAPDPEDWTKPKGWATPGSGDHVPGPKDHIEPDTGPDPNMPGPDLDMGNADTKWTE